MVVKLVRISLLALALTLSACFRPAGEPIEPTPNTNPPAPTREEPEDAVTSLPGFDAMTEEVTSEVNVETTPNLGALNQLGGTLPPITVISPTRPTGATQQAFDVNSTALPGGTPQFITPGVPMGQIPRSPTPVGGALTSTPSGMVTPTAMFDGSEGGCSYIVQPGDSLFRISNQLNVSLDEMRAANPDLVGEAPILQPGQQLNVPNCGQQAAPPADAGVEAPAPTDAPLVAPPGGEVYSVQSGDTLMTIARRFNTTIEAIVAANSLANPDRLDIGQELIIPPPSS
jgi:LysM repeat protein